MVNHLNINNILFKFNLFQWVLTIKYIKNHKKIGYGTKNHKIYWDN